MYARCTLDAVDVNLHRLHRPTSVVTSTAISFVCKATSVTSTVFVPGGLDRRPLRSLWRTQPIKALKAGASDLVTVRY